MSKPVSNRVKVHVTAEHIKKGRKEACSRCPVALALQAAGFRGARVGASRWWIGTNTNSLLGYGLPWKAKKFIAAFDEGRGGKPFSFTVERPVKP